MRLGIASALSHNSPQQWAEQLKAIGCKSTVFPLNCNDDKVLVRAYVEAAKENDIVIAEVGIWNNMLDSNLEKRKVNIDYAIRQIKFADEIVLVCAVNIAETPHGPRWAAGYRDNFS